MHRAPSLSRGVLSCRAGEVQAPARSCGGPQFRGFRQIAGDRRTVDRGHVARSCGGRSIPPSRPLPPSWGCEPSVTARFQASPAMFPCSASSGRSARFAETCGIDRIGCRTMWADDVHGRIARMTCRKSTRRPLTNSETITDAQGDEGEPCSRGHRCPLGPRRRQPPSTERSCGDYPFSEVIKETFGRTTPEIIELLHGGRTSETGTLVSFRIPGSRKETLEILRTWNSGHKA